LYYNIPNLSEMDLTQNIKNVAANTSVELYNMEVKRRYSIFGASRNFVIKVILILRIDDPHIGVVY
jgi:hypothetical protein